MEGARQKRVEKVRRGPSISPSFPEQTCTVWYKDDFTFMHSIDRMHFIQITRSRWLCLKIDPHSVPGTGLYVH